MSSRIIGPKVLLVEGNNHLLKMLKTCLVRHDIHLTRYPNLQNIPPLLYYRYSLLIIDTNLALKNNAVTIEKIREQNLFLHIIVIGPNTLENKIKSCQLGVDLYHSKPIDCTLLQAQISQLLCFHHKKVVLRAGDIKIDIASQSFYINKKNISFTYKEFLLLQLLFRTNGQVLSRSKISRHFSGNYSDLSYAAIDTSVSRIRSKLKGHLNEPLIKTKFKLGYYINPHYLQSLSIEKNDI